MELSAEECLRRCLLHVLPKRFVRIRHYGLLAIHGTRYELVGYLRTRNPEEPQFCHQHFPLPPTNYPGRRRIGNNRMVVVPFKPPNTRIAGGSHTKQCRFEYRPHFAVMIRLRLQ